MLQPCQILCKQAVWRQEHTQCPLYIILYFWTPFQTTLTISIKIKTCFECNLNIINVLQTGRIMRIITNYFITFEDQKKY